MQARFRVAPVILLGATCSRSYPHRHADVVFSRPRAFLALIASRARPSTSHRLIKCGAASGRLATRVKSRLSDCGREWREACGPVTRYVCALATLTLFLGRVAMRQAVSVRARSLL